MTNIEETDITEIMNNTGLRTPHILIVDDENLIRWSLKNMLQKIGFDITVADSGDAAMEKLCELRFDLVITDMKLPRADGFQVAAAVRKYSPDAPIIMISAFGDSRSREKAREFKIDYFMDKPFDFTEFIGFVKTILESGGRNDG